MDDNDGIDDSLGAIEDRIARMAEDDSARSRLVSDEDAEAELSATMARLRERAANPSPEPVAEATTPVAADVDTAVIPSFLDDDDDGPLLPFGDDAGGWLDSAEPAAEQEDLTDDVAAEVAPTPVARPRPEPQQVSQSARLVGDDDLDLGFEDDLDIDLDVSAERSSLLGNRLEPLDELEPEPAASDVDDLDEDLLEQRNEFGSLDGDEDDDVDPLAGDLENLRGGVPGITSPQGPRARRSDEPLLPGQQVPTTRLATPAQMAAADAEPPIRLEAVDGDPVLPGVRVPKPAAPASPTELLGSLGTSDSAGNGQSESFRVGQSGVDAIDHTDEPPEVLIPDRERSNLAFYFLLAVFLVVFGVLIWWTIWGKDASTADSEPTAPVQVEATTQPSIPAPVDPTPSTNRGLRIEEALPLIDTKVERCDSTGLLGTVLARTSQPVQLDLRVSFIAPDGVTYFTTDVLIGRVDPQEARSFSYLLFDKPIAEEYLGIEPAECTFEPIGVFGA